MLLSVLINHPESVSITLYGYRGFGEIGQHLVGVILDVGTVLGKGK